MKKTVLIPIFLLMSLFLQSQHEASSSDPLKITIGSTEWYSEAIAHEDLLKIAHKENKPILTVFSAAWCGPCQQMKKTAFLDEGFRKVADQVILQYIEQTTPQGKVYCQRFAVRGYPTIKMFSPTGEQLEEEGTPERTAAGFLTWVSKVKAGDNLFETRRKAREKPDDPGVRLKLAKSLGHHGLEESHRHLNQILADPDLEKKSPDLFQEAMELKGQLAEYHLSQLSYSRATGPGSYPPIQTLPEYAALRRHMDHLFQLWAPDKFRFSLQKNWLYTFMTWYAKTGEYERLTAIFEQYGRHDRQVDWEKCSNSIEHVMKAYGQLGQVEKMTALLDEFRRHLLDKGNLNQDMYAGYAFVGAYRALIDHHLERNHPKEAEAVLAAALADLKANQISAFDQLFLHFYGIEKKLAPSLFLDQAEADLKASTSKDRFARYFTLGSLLCAAGQRDRARVLFESGLEDPQLIAGLPEDQQALMKAQMIHGLAENGFFDEAALKLGETLLAKQRTPSTLSAVASIRAGLGHQSEAILLLTEAKGLSRDPEKIAGYEKKISELQLKTKKAAE